MQTDNYEINSQSFNKLHNNLNDENTTSSINNSLHGDLYQVIQNFDEMNSKEIVESLMMSKPQGDNKTKNLGIIIDDIVDLILDEINKGIEPEKRHQHIFDYL